MAFTQSGRWIEVEFAPPALDKNGTLVTHFSGGEALNRLYSFQVQLLNPTAGIKPEAVLGKEFAFSVAAGQAGKRRYFHGVVSRFSTGPAAEHGLYEYALEIVPELWLLSHRVDSRIFQEKSVPDIVKEVLAEAGIRAYEVAGSLGTHPPREYCVQYLESDLAFIQRLLEEVGLYWYFRHEAGRHRFMIGSEPAGYYKIDEPDIDIRPDLDAQNAITSWDQSHHFLPADWAHTDYDFKVPNKPMLAQAKSRRIKLQRQGKWEVFDFPGGYLDKGQGEGIARQRVDSVDGGFALVEGQGGIRSFSPGGKFQVADDSAGGARKGWVVTEVHHVAQDFTHLTGTQDGPPSYSNRFTCAPDSVPFRPMRRTTKPIIPGAQTAVVVGPAGEEIFTDEYGRIRVQFHWDRRGKRDEKSSCWIRVAQIWAGQGWGTAFTPRIGMEVVVTFLDGDPDCPLVTGCVYNGENMPPWAASGTATQSGVKTRSSMKGGDANANLLRFEDKKGSEEVFFHAEKDFNREVENDDTLDVGNDQTEQIKNNRTVTITSGDDKLHVKAGERYVEAAKKITLKVGGSTIVMDPTSITMKSMVIKIEGQQLVEVKGLLIKEEGGALMTLQAPLIKIN